MLLKGFWQMRIPVHPVVPTCMLPIRVWHLPRFEKGVKSSIVSQQMIVKATIKRQAWH